MSRASLVVATMPDIIKAIEEGNTRHPVVNILNVLKEDFNCTITTPADKQYGSFIEDTKQWSGMIGMLLEGTADVALENLGISYDRHLVVEFSHYLDIEAHHIFSVLAEGSEEAGNDIMHVFGQMSNAIYISLFVSITVATLISYVAEEAVRIATNQISSSSRVLPLMKIPNEMPHTRRNISIEKAMHQIRMKSYADIIAPDHTIGMHRSLFRIVYDFYAFIVGQGVPLLPQTTSARTMTWFYWLGMLLFVNFFTGFIQTDLVTDDQQLMIDDLETVVRNSQLMPIVGKGTLVEDTFKTAPSESNYGKLWKRMLEDPNITSTRDFTASSPNSPLSIRLLSRKFVLVRSEPGLNSVGQAMCEHHPDNNFHLSKENLFDRQHGMVYRRTLDLSIRKRIDKRLSSIVESGIYGYWLRNKFGLRAECFTSDDTDGVAEAVALGITNFIILFYCLLGGSAFSIVLLIEEVVIGRCMKPQRAKETKTTGKIKVFRRHLH